ncbi:MAG: hypothetical protein ACK5S9_07190, partial [Roseiflexaceae bacterium]
VMAGNYNENVIINKPLTLRGPNYGIDPNQTARQPEAHIYPATGNVTTALSSRVITIASSDVFIDGFLIDGDNADLASLILGTNNADIDARTGIENSVAVNNVSVTNNIIQNLLFAGVRFQSTAGASPAVTSGHDIRANLIRDLGTYQVAGGFERNGTGIVLQNTHYATIENNVIEHARIGVQANNFRFANPASTTYGIAENSINVRAVGVLLNGHLVAPWQIAENTISARNNENEMNLGSVWRGIQILNMTAGIGNTELTANDIDGTGLELIASEGVTVWNVPESALVEISQGTISNTSVGVNINNYEGNNFNATRGSYATIEDVTIAARSTGVRIHDSTRSAHATVSATFGDGVVFQGGAQGLSIENASAQVPVLGNVTFVGQLANYIRLVNNTSTLDATAVSFDGVASPTASVANFHAIEDKILHKQDDSALGMVRVTAGTLYTTATGSIQRSINNAINGEIIHVQAGTYPEILVVDKTIQLLGANAGIVGSASSRGAESIIVPPVDTVPTEALTELVTVTAADVVIDGLTVNGSNNDASAATYTSKGANLLVDVGIYATAPGVLIRNSVVQNTFQFGVLLGGEGSTPMYGQVLNNRVDNAAWFAGIAARNNYYALIDSNTIQDSWRGIQTNNHSLPAPTDSVVQISNNTINQQTVTVVGDMSYANVNGIMHNLQYGTATPWRISANTMSNSDAASARTGSVGIELDSLAVSATIT